jgi:PBP1b-binding outer membrane lipoprotein LpoB
MKKNLIHLSLFASAFFIISCSGGKKAEESSAEKKEEIESFVEKEFTYPLPTAFEVSQMLSNANTSFSKEIVNDPSNADQYVATWQKAANLGVYGADLSYAATFDKTQETIDFLDVSKKLIDDLNITSAFNESMAQRIENNMDNVDSLIFIVTESFYDTYNYLNQNGEQKTSILVIAGSVIEGLHITCELVKMSENKGELMAVLANQKAQVVKLVELMESHQDDEDVSKVLPNLRYISLVYDQLGEESEMTEGQFNDIANSVKEMRDHIVG